MAFKTVQVFTNSEHHLIFPKCPNRLKETSQGTHATSNVMSCSLSGLPDPIADERDDAQDSRRGYQSREYERDNGQGSRQGYRSRDYERDDGQGSREGYQSREYKPRDRRFDNDRSNSGGDVGGSVQHDTIYISNLPQTVTEEALEDHFKTIGIIKEDKKTRKPKIWIYMDKVKNVPKGDATVTYDDPPAADAAINIFGGKEFMGNIITVTKATRQSDFGGRPKQQGRGGYNGRNERGGGPAPREGDWICEPCGANNFARRSDCHKCQAGRGGRQGGGGGGYRGNRGDNDYGRQRGGGGGGRDDGAYQSERYNRRDRPY